jgi:hypothetical protein
LQINFQVRKIQTVTQTVNNFSQVPEKIRENLFRELEFLGELRD